MSRLMRRAFAAFLAVLTVACARQPSDRAAGSREAREAMLFTAASQFRISAQQLDVVEFRRVVWRDTCLEIRRRAACVRELTPGYRLRIRRDGALYEYRAPEASPTDLALASAPDPRVGTPALVWTWESAPRGCQMLAISADERPAIGWCDGPVVEVEWLPELSSRAEWHRLHSRFAPFRLDTGEHGDHTLVFRGTGPITPSPAWQRALNTWAALRWAELQAGRSGAAHGRALAYRSPNPRSIRCDILEATEYGTAYVGSSARCDAGNGETGRSVWLSDALWEELSRWLHEWRAYGDTAGLYFFGRGNRAFGPDDATRLRSWARRAVAHARSDSAVTVQR